MGLLDRLHKKKPEPAAKPTLLEDIPKAADWLVKNMEATGYHLDGTIESFRELDRFFDEQSRPGGVLAGSRPGSKLFAVGSYMGQVFVQELGGVWETDDEDPEGEVNIAVHLPNGITVWPVVRAMKRLRNGAEDGLYVYGRFAAGTLEEADPNPITQS